ncbi:hypothetical protein H310_14060 [Aphanomyces invadans]|uniref:Uncharacterized protein n=1 Tax=Aphanomyces invadans TaxID=157072 RepID=A0A024TB89_9STRA|nr:hypothetical protein H310_14060 [Aphanomyces invadans]ETV91385.1 hypothetical protein H310_14060 [Aphanomyces invadans]|eukprot:XP_008880013.1 hypothetical protein H310_14060 [Aphanomyces invadans]
MRAAWMMAAAVAASNDCATLGYGNAPTCKECHDVDNASRAACLGCCVPAATFPQLKIQDATPGFSVQYKRGNLPTLLMYDENEELQDSVIVVSWDQPSLDAYLALHLKPSPTVIAAHEAHVLAMRAQAGRSDEL